MNIKSGLSRKAFFRDKIWYFQQVISVLSLPQKKKLVTLILVQSILSLIDLVGILLFAALASIAISGSNSSNLSPRLERLILLLGIDEKSQVYQLLILGTLTFICVLFKSILSIQLVNYTLRFIGHIASGLSTMLVSRLLAQPLTVLQSKSSQSILFAATRGVDYLVLFTLGPATLLIVDILILLIIYVFLLSLQTSIAVFVLILFATIGYVLHRFVNSKVTSLGREAAKLQVTSNEKIIEAFSLYREILVRNSRNSYVDEVSKIRQSLTQTSVEFSLKPYFGKYLIETSVVLGSIVITVFQFAYNSPYIAIANISLFFAAGSRIAPLFLRAQQSLLTIKGSLGQAKETLNLLSQLGNERIEISLQKYSQFTHGDFRPHVKLEDLNFSYRDSTKFQLRDINIEVFPGDFVAIKGDSGAGKSTLVDLILGINPATQGRVTISGLPPREAIAKWPGAIGYVPQEVPILSGTFKENICLGLELNTISDDLVWEALKLASLATFVEGLPEKINTRIGEGELRLSGGQRQRVGIARAMLTNPKLLIFDEATSSLDETTEDAITEAIFNFRGSRTILLISHNPNFIKDVEYVYVMKDGMIDSKETASTHISENKATNIQE